MLHRSIALTHADASAIKRMNDASGAERGGWRSLKPDLMRLPARLCCPRRAVAAQQQADPMIIGNPRPSHQPVRREYQGATTRRKMAAAALLASFVLVMGVILTGLLTQKDEEGRVSIATARKVASSPAKLEPPMVEPVELVRIDEDGARRINAATPFVKGPVMPAKPFILRDDVENHDRARDCMASAL